MIRMVMGDEKIGLSRVDSQFFHSRFHGLKGFITIEARVNDKISFIRPDEIGV
ncbi:hypothetical protein DENIS_2819 [Desulfonema ishimotonii]|uniref:Uncharacterized protein n=1 Tax=Desulfonema ishimotonii TaxID=45657 RepID=A0A401FY07_9BACT|nr:hypothetical protein DENIS_2819 [Desulfonema ishimotonii]